MTTMLDWLAEDEPVTPESVAAVIAAVEQLLERLPPEAYTNDRLHPRMQSLMELLEVQIYGRLACGATPIPGYPSPVAEIDRAPVQAVLISVVEGTAA